MIMKNWKRLELQTAQSLGGERAGNYREFTSDVLNVPGWVIECKYRAEFKHDTLYRTEKTKRKKELRTNKKFALVTRAKNKEPLVTIALKDFQEIIGNPGKNENVA